MNTSTPRLLGRLLAIDQLIADEKRDESPSHRAIIALEAEFAQLAVLFTKRMIAKRTKHRKEAA
jgi:hypothetical protein